MLLRVTLTNFLCFRGEASLTLVAGSDDSHPAHIIAGGSKAAPRVLRGAALYGANGHGKTKFVEALETLQKIVVEGCDEDESYINMGFSLSPADAEKPTVFNVEFNYKGIDYDYGIAVAEDHIVEEWLYSRPNVKEVMLFERTTVRNGDKFSTTVKPGNTLLEAMRTQNDLPPAQLFAFVASGTRETQPFLTEAVDRNIDALKAAHGWFTDGLVIVGADAEFGSLHLRSRADPDFVARMSEFVRRADTGIHRVEAIEEVFDVNTFPGMTTSARKDILDKIGRGDLIVKSPEGQTLVLRRGDEGGIVAIRIVAIHKGSEGEEYAFRIEDESAGTQRLLHLAPMIFALSKSDRTFIVDEVYRKLHPLLAYEFIDTFLKEGNAGQIVFTTHNTHLLDLKLLRRDEIWFVQKDGEGSSSLYSLSDIRVRNDINIERGYLDGRFGAIPFIGNVRDLGWTG